MSATEQAIARLLSHRYGDGIVYLSRDNERPVFNAAMARGYVGRDGFVTRKGRRLLARAGRLMTSVGE